MARMDRAHRGWGLGVVLLAACSRSNASTETSSATSASATAASATAASATPPAASASTAPAAAPAPSHAMHASVVPFIENDYARALAAAKASGRPLFVDAWAPWCHSCLSMREYVFTDARLAKMADRFVWLAVDTESADNADFLARFPTMTLPTLWVIDPATETATMKWIGAATAAELDDLLDDAAAGVKGASGGDAMAAFVRGNQASGSGKLEDAVREYKKALATSPPSWKRRPAVVEALGARLLELARFDECVDLSIAETPKLPRGTSQSNVLQAGFMCAYSLPATSPARAKIAPLVDEARRIVADPTYPFLADDRSGMYEHLVNILHDSDPAGAKNMARSWALFLENEARRANTPAARAVWDPHRLGAYIELGEVAKAIPMLEASARDFPDDYNPPARLARAFFELKRFDEAQAAVDRALAKAYGPRKLQIYMLASDIRLAKGDVAGAKKALADAIDEASSMRMPVKYARMREELDRRLADLAKR
jgi:tetratricopeptide (TPR) repeat protein